MPNNKKSKSGINHRILVHFTPAANIRFARLGIFTSKAIVLHINKGLVSGHTTERARLRKKEKIREKKCPATGEFRTHDLLIMRRALYSHATTAALN